MENKAMTRPPIFTPWQDYAYQDGVRIPSLGSTLPQKNSEFGQSVAMFWINNKMVARQRGSMSSKHSGHDALCVVAK